jgi:predicted sulfurtransferase
MSTPKGWLTIGAACGLTVLSLAGRARAQYAAPADGAPRITQQQFKTLIAKKDVFILDTRNEDVYRLGHIPGALLLPLEGLQIWPSQYGPLVDRLKTEKRPIVAYCA